MASSLSNLLSDTLRAVLGLPTDDDAEERFYETGRRARRAARMFPNRAKRPEKLPPHELAMPIPAKVAAAYAQRDAGLQAAWDRTHSEDGDGSVWVFPQTESARRAARAAGRRQRAARRITRRRAA